MKLQLSFLKKRSARDDTAVRERPEARAGGRGIPTLLFPMLLSSIAVLVVVAALTYAQFVLVGQQRAEEQTQREAANIAANLTGRVQGYADVLAAVGKSPAVVKAMETHDVAALEQQTSYLRQLFPAVLRVLFIPKGEAYVQETLSPPLSFACVELAREAERNNIPLVEAHLYGTKLQHVDLVRPVPGPQGVLGSVLVTLDVAVAPEWLKLPTTDANSYVELRQRVDSMELVLGATGNEALRGTTAVTVLPINGTAWSLYYWTPTRQSALTLMELTALATVFGGSLMVLILAYGALGAVVRRIVQRDLAAVAKQTMGMVRGQRQHNFDASLKESLDVLNGVEEQLHGIKAKMAHPDPAKVAKMRGKGVADDNPFIAPDA